jgi:ribonuclease P protein subunit POP4
MGLSAKVVWSSDKGYLGIEGLIVMESRNMIVLETKNQATKRIPKKSVVLELSVPGNGKIQIAGTDIVGRPENRIKKKK